MFGLFLSFVCLVCLFSSFFVFLFVLLLFLCVCCCCWVFCYCSLSWVSFACFLFIFLSFLFPLATLCGLQVLGTLARSCPGLPMWKFWVQDAGLLEKSEAQRILIGVCFPRGIHLEPETRLHPLPASFGAGHLMPNNQQEDTVPQVSKTVQSHIKPTDTPKTAPYAAPTIEG